MGLSEDARTVGARAQPQAPRRLRRTKLLTAFGVAAVVGLVSYTATYRALVIVSTPSAPTGSIAPAPTGSTTLPTAAQPHP